MPDPLTVSSETPKRVGIAADHGGYELKEYLAQDVARGGS